MMPSYDYLEPGEMCRINGWRLFWDRCRSDMLAAGFLMRNAYQHFQFLRDLYLDYHGR